MIDELEKKFKELEGRLSELEKIKSELREREVTKIGNSYFVKLKPTDMKDLKLHIGKTALVGKK